MITMSRHAHIDQVLQRATWVLGQLQEAAEELKAAAAESTEASEELRQVASERTISSDSMENGDSDA